MNFHHNITSLSFSTLKCVRQLEMPSKATDQDEGENTQKQRLVPVRGKGLCYLDGYGLETVGINFTLKPVAETCKRNRYNIQKGILYIFKLHGDRINIFNIIFKS